MFESPGAPGAAHSNFESGRVATSACSVRFRVGVSSSEKATIPIDNLGLYNVVTRGWAYCSFVGSSAPFYDTGDSTSSQNIPDWVTAYGVGADDYGNVVFRQEDYNDLMNQGFVPAGAGVAIAVTQPELWPVIGTAIVAVAISYIGKEAASAIKRLNYDRDLLDYCRKKLIQRLETASWANTGNANTCYGFCTNQGFWPTNMCPLR